MSIFGKRNRKHYFLELCKITDQQSATEFDTQEFIVNTVELLQNATNLKADEFNLNYSSKSYKTIKGFKSRFEKYSEVVYCFIGFNSNKTNTYFTVSNPMLNYLKNAKRPKNSAIDISFQVNEDHVSDSEIRSVAEELIRKFHFEYGCIHKFPTGRYHGETRTKSGLFSTTTSASKTDHIWTNHKIGILNGYIKKLYQVNYLNKSQTDNLSLARAIKSRGEVQEISNDITRWILTDEDYQIKQKELQDASIVTDDFRFENNPISSQLKDRMTVE